MLIFLLVIIACSLFFGFIVLLNGRGWEKIQNRRFFAFAFVVSLWQIINMLMLSSHSAELALLWTKLSYAGGIVASYFLIRFIIIFPKQYVGVFLGKFIDYFSLSITVLATFLCLTPLVISEINFDTGTLSALNGQYYFVFPVALIALFLGFFVLSLFNFNKSKDDSKSQVKFVLIGISLTLLSIIVLDIIAPVIVGNDSLSNFDVFSTVFIVIFTAYAIIKYQLFDIKVILTETATGIVALTLLVQTFLSETVTRGIINGTVFVLVSFGGYLIIKSVLREIEQKEQLQVLSKQLGEANIHLKDLDKMKTEFVSLASHELLTPVSAIEGYLSMMLDEKLVKLEDPKAVQYMDRVYRSAKRLARLISDMLNISRIEEGRLLVEKKDTNMVEVIQQVIEELKFKADEHKQTVVFAGAESEKLKAKSSNEVINNISNEPSAVGRELDANSQPSAVSREPVANFMTYADPDKVKEILVNIIGNSIKYTLQPGTITVTIEKAPTSVLNSEWGKLEQAILASPVDDQESIHAVGDEHMKQIVGDQQYLIRVKDQGVGIPKEELTKLFKKFHRVGNYSTQESQGTGLGLYITRALVELHHGRIWPDSEGEGKGSTFTFSLPTIESKQAIVDMEAQSPQDKEQLKPLAKPMGNDDEL